MEISINIYWEGSGELAFPVSNFWSVIHMSEHSRITVDMLNALNDQTWQRHSQHNEVMISPYPTPESFIHWESEVIAYL